MLKSTELRHEKAQVLRIVLPWIWTVGEGKQCHNFSSVFFLTHTFSLFSQAAEQRYRSLHYTAPKPHLSWYRNQNSPRSHLSAWAELRGSHGQWASRRENLIHIPAQEGIPRASPALQPQRCRAPRAQSRAARGRRSRRTNSPWLRSVCGTVPLSPQTDRQTEGVSVLHPALLDVLGSPLRAQGCWHCRLCLLGPGASQFHSDRAVTHGEEKATKQLKKN